jgi:hypothetical protein
VNGAVCLCCDFWVVGNHYNGLMEFLAGDFQKFDHFIAGLTVQIAGWLVSKDNGRFAG